MQTICVSPEWLATEERYAITYYINGQSKYFQANKLKMARLCKSTGWIKRYFIGVTQATVTTWNPEDPDEEINISLLKMIRGWNQKNWIDFITSYEQSIMLGVEYNNTVEKYKVA